MSVNEDNIETLVGSANIAVGGETAVGGEKDKVTFKDEKANETAAKNLGSKRRNDKVSV